MAIDVDVLLHGGGGGGRGSQLDRNATERSRLLTTEELWGLY